MLRENKLDKKNQEIKTLRLTLKHTMNQKSLTHLCLGGMDMVTHGVQEITKLQHLVMMLRKSQNATEWIR